MINKELKRKDIREDILSICNNDINKRRDFHKRENEIYNEEDERIDMENCYFTSIYAVSKIIDKLVNLKYLKSDEIDPFLYSQFLGINVLTFKEMKKFEKNIDNEWIIYDR